VTITYARLDLYVSSEGSTSDNRLYECYRPVELDGFVLE
jgi:hypothetical protein